MSVINTNISAMAAQSSLRKTGLNQDTAMERLSTGIRINNAKDDAAGLAISTRMTANIRGISAAIRNANDGISLTQTAEGSLSAIGDNLQRIRELAVQSANTGNNSSDRSALNAEATQLVAEIDRVANNSAFNGIKLLDGSFQNQSLQVGAGNDSNDRITISISNAKASSLGVGSGSSYSTTTTSLTVGSAAITTAGSVTINGYNVGATVADGVSSTGDKSSAISKANAINAITGQTGVTAVVGATVVTAIAGSATAATFTLGINGVTVTGTTDATAKGAASSIAAAINAVSSQTGVVASVDSGATGAYTLTAADGRNVDLTTTSVGQSGLTAATSYGKLSLTSSQSTGITVGGTALSAIGATVGYSAATATAGAGVSSIDLTTAAGAQSALSTLDKAINTVTDSRAAMGAYQNRLAATISNLETTSVNLSASRSRILDTDYAKETTNLAKAQIITQAATAMLAQANQSAQSVLALLK
ncbi:flagellin [Limnohabitans sp. Rim11]|uniref:flagellin N-terminal helical domain-containing protein n=1 Tax=Limnohabitans sp. Rim11 TaxID=1100719 RepID=UPI000A9DF906|nr:flagellin [Limnohabitans sp. Rim11]